MSQKRKKQQRTTSVYEDLPLATATGYLSDGNDSSGFQVSADEASYDINDVEINTFVARIGHDIPIASARDSEIINQLIGYVKTLQSEKQTLMKENTRIKDEKGEIEEEYWALKQENYRLISENQVRKSVLKEQKEDFMHAIRHSFSLPNQIALPHSNSFNAHHSNPNLASPNTLSPNNSMLNLFQSDDKNNPLKNIFNENEMKDLQNELEDQHLSTLKEAVSAEEQELDAIESKINSAKKRLIDYEKKCEKLELLEKENTELKKKLEIAIDNYDKMLIEKDQTISDQSQLISDQLQMMQKMEDDINKLEGHIKELNDYINKENQDISYLQEQLKSKEAEIAQDKHKRDQSTNAMLFKYSTMRNVESPKPGRSPNARDSAEFANYTPWDQIAATSLSFKSVDLDEWGVARGRGLTIPALEDGHGTLPEDDEIDFDLKAKVFELEKEVNELKLSREELQKQMDLERKEFDFELSKYENLEQENIELQDKNDSLEERIVAMKVEYRAALKDDHDETASLLTNRSSTKVVKNNNKKNANSCVMFGFGIW